MLRECLLEFKNNNFEIPYVGKTINYLVENFDEDQLSHLFKIGVKIDQNHLLLQYNTGVGWRCLNEDYNYVGVKPICRTIEKSLNNILLCQNTSNSSWFLPTLTTEIDELQEKARELKINPRDLLRAVGSAIVKGTLMELSDQDWNAMENTDSCFKLTIEQVRTISKKCDGIFESLSHNRPMEAPIVLFRENHPPYLLTGNTRLMVSKLLKNRPKILPVYIF